MQFSFRTPTNEPLTYELSQPTWDAQEGVCKVYVSSLVGEAVSIRGVDPLNALTNAIAFVESHLISTPEKCILWENGLTLER
jgi:hypothetical protein